jgi:hypothetical protein
MRRRLLTTTLLTLLLVGTAACALGGGGAGSPCDAPVDDEPTTFAVTADTEGNPNVLEGCIDENTDTDTVDLTDAAANTNTFPVRCFAETGLVEFDTPGSTSFVACTPTGSSWFNHNDSTTTDVVVRAQGSGTGGEYRLELFVS